MKYRSEIDGLRALAVVPVIFFHAGFEIFSGGFVGVDVFFVISGYLITTILINDLKSGSFSIVSFYERRARRILPALSLVIFCCLPFAWYWLLPDDAKNFSQSMLSVSLFSSNIFFWRTSDYFDTATNLKPLIHTWSLSVEEQYYVFFPLFLLVFWHRGKAWIVYVMVVTAIVSFGLAQWFVYSKPSFAFYTLPTRAWELLIGAFVAFYYSEKNIKKHGYWMSEFGSALGVSLVLYSVFFYDEQTPFPSIYSLVPTLGASLIIVFATHKTFVGRVLSAKPFLWIGLVSYSAYLWHQPLFAFARNRSISEPSFSLFSGLVVFTFLLSYFTWRYVERPFRNRNFFSRTNVFVFAIFSSFSFFLVGLTGYLNEGFPGRVPVLADRIIQTKYSLNKKPCVSNFFPQEVKNAPCVLGNESKIIGALIGDSHAGAISYSLGERLKTKNFGFFDFAIDGCIPVFGVSTTNAGIECIKNKYSDFEYIKSNNNIRFLVIVGRWSKALNGYSFDNGEGGVEASAANSHRVVLNEGQLSLINSGSSEYVKIKLIETIEAYLSTNKTVILVYPIPEAGWDIPVVLAKSVIFDGLKDIGSMLFSTDFSVYKERNREAIDLFDSIGDRPNLIRVKPSNFLCDTYVPNRCVTQVRGTPLYFDDDHLNSLGADLIAGDIVSRLF